MVYLRKFALRIRFAVLILVLDAGVLAQQASRLPSIIISGSQQGIKISAVNGALPSARVLRLANPDRLVLDFDQTDFRFTGAERNLCAAHGVRVGFHAETATTRVVFDIPSGEQRWMKLEREAVLVEYRSPAQKPATPDRVVAAEPSTRVTSPVVAPSRANVAAVAPTSYRKEEAPPRDDGTTHLRVKSSDGLLQVSARGVPFKAILDAVAEVAGGTVQMMTPVNEGQPQIFEYGPAPPLEVIRKLFEGSRYNYLVISEPNDTTRISRIVVTSALHYSMGNDGPVADDDSNPESLQGITPLAPKQEPPADEKKPN